MTDFTAEQIAEVISADPRVRHVMQGVELQAQMQANGPLRAVLEAIGADADAAMTEFAEADIGDARRVMTLQARVYRNHIALKTFEAIIQRAQSAQHDIAGEQPNEDSE